MHCTRTKLFNIHVCKGGPNFRKGEIWPPGGPYFLGNLARGDHILGEGQISWDTGSHINIPSVFERGQHPGFNNVRCCWSNMFPQFELASEGVVANMEDLVVLFT